MVGHGHGTPQQMQKPRVEEWSTARRLALFGLSTVPPPMERSRPGRGGLHDRAGTALSVTALDPG